MRKSNIKHLLKLSIDSSAYDNAGASDFDPLFQRYEKNLYQTHNVPRIKIHQPKYW